MTVGTELWELGYKFCGAEVDLHELLPAVRASTTTQAVRSLYLLV